MTDHKFFVNFWAQVKDTFRKQFRSINQSIDQSVELLRSFLIFNARGERGMEGKTWDWKQPQSQGVKTSRWSAEFQLWENLKNKFDSSLAEEKGECPTNKKHVSLMGTEFSWMQKYKQNINEICLYTVTVMNKGFLLCISGPGSGFPSCGTGNVPSKCRSVFRESIVP